MNQKQVNVRWGMSYADLLPCFAAQGLSIRDTASALGVSHAGLREAVRKLGIASQFENVAARSSASRRLRQPFWLSVEDNWAAGMTRTQSAAILGYDPQAFMFALRENPELDPYSPWHVAADYLRTTGETVVAGARRMAAQGMTKTEAARAIGYASSNSLDDALASRGASIEFKKRMLKPKKYFEGYIGRLFPKTPGPHPWKVAARKEIAQHERMGTSSQ
jgi:hypothetical protein